MNPTTWAVEGDLDIFSLQDQTAKVKPLVASSGGLTVNLSGLGDIDPSGLQLLLSIKASLQAKGKAFLVIGLPEPLRERMLALGAGALFSGGGS